MKKKKSSLGAQNRVTYRPGEAAAIYGVSRSQLYEYFARGLLPSVRIPGRQGRRGVRLIFKRDLDSLLKKYRNP